MKKIALLSFCLLFTVPAIVHAQGAMQEQTTGSSSTKKSGETTAQENAMGAVHGDESAIYLEPAEAKAPKDTITRVSKSEMDAQNARNLVDAIKNTPGISHGLSGGRNEQTIRVRGFDQRQTPIFVNGMPIYTPYDGYSEAGMLQTFDLESIEVSKGYTSSLLGSNTMGGAINMRMAKPKKKFEFETQYTNDFDSRLHSQGQTVTTSIGTKQDKWYLRLNGLYNNQDYFRTADSFTSTSAQKGTKRPNSGSEDAKFSGIFGITPNETTDIYLTYINQKSEKEQPLEANGFKRYWRWPQWDKQSIMLNADIVEDDDTYVKTMVFYDSYNNKMNDYASSSFTDLNQQSKYRDFAYGARTEASYRFNEYHKLAASALFKRDSHRRIESNYKATDKAPAYDNLNTETFIENNWTLGLEYTFNPIKTLTFVFGGNYNILDPQDATSKGWHKGSSGDWLYETLPGIKPKSATTALDYSLGVFWDVAEQHQIYTTFAKKTRFATIKERYTSGFDGTKLPNPDLDPEKAFNVELGYRGTLYDSVKVNGAVFYSKVSDLITSVATGVKVGTKDQTKNENVDKARLYGAELGADVFINDYVSLGGNFSYLNWKNLSSSNNLTDRPKYLASGYAEITPIEGLKLTPRVEYQGRSFKSSNKPDKLNSIILSHFKASYELTDNVEVEAGVRNLFDKRYELSDGYPAEGRAYFTSVKISF